MNAGEALDERRSALAERGELDERRRRNLEGEVEALAVSRLREHARRAMSTEPGVKALVDGGGRREVDPLTAVGALVDAVVDGRPT